MLDSAQGARGSVFLACSFAFNKGEGASGSSHIREETKELYHFRGLWGKWNSIHISVETSMKGIGSRDLSNQIIITPRHRDRTRMIIIG